MGIVRKKLNLPSGATVVIRPLKGMDYTQAGAKHIPVVLEARKRVRERSKGKAEAENTDEDFNFSALTVLLSLTRATSPITFPDGSRFKIVDKELDELGNGEISIGDLDDADVATIISEVTKLTGGGEEAAIKASPFPDQRTGDLQSSPAGQDVREASQSDPGTVVAPLLD
jgi:hypothetical protein